MALISHDSMAKPNRGEESYADDLREAFGRVLGREPEADAPEAEPVEEVHPLKPRATLKPEREPDPEVDTSEPDGSQESKYGDPETELSIKPEIEEREAVKTVEAEPKVKAPEHWSDEDKSKLAALPDDKAREAILQWRTQIEKGAQEKFNAAAEARKFADEVGGLMAPFDAELQAAGMTRAQGIKRLVDAERLLRSDPQAGLNWLLSQYGQGQFEVVRKGAQPAAQPGEQPKPNGGDGHLSRYTTEGGTPLSPALITQLVDQRLQSHAQAAERQQFEQAMKVANVNIQEFAEAKGEDGQPLRPHFDAVKVQMGALMQSGAADTLESAYEQAIWTQPALREQLTKAQQEAATAAAAEAQRQAIAKAKAARTPKTSSVHVPAEDEDENLPTPQLLRKVWRQQAGGERS